ncbi:hypothetical protein E2320_006332 [Naja naja]|nr:hypothetical protein E2320_006332 [Naja naja]
MSQFSSVKTLIGSRVQTNLLTEKMGDRGWAPRYCRWLKLAFGKQNKIGLTGASCDTLLVAEKSKKHRVVIPWSTHFKDEYKKVSNLYAKNRIRTTKYRLWSFIPRNLFEQFHRVANLYFLFIALLNWVPAVEAFRKEITMIPLCVVLTIIAVKDALEDYTKYKLDKKINNFLTRAYCRYAYEINPEDIICRIECETPNNDLNSFRGFIENVDGVRVGLNKDNLLMRGCIVRNTEAVVGIVVYAGHETKAMLNTTGARYKRSKLEKRMNRDILWCVLLLIVMCFIGAIGHRRWLRANPTPPLYASGKELPAELGGFLMFWTMIILLQVLIPISLYVSIEFVKLGQIFLIRNDIDLYDEVSDRKIQCGSLNIAEDLGQIEYIFSDKTGTLTENKMVFRRCSIAGHASRARFFSRKSSEFLNSRIFRSSSSMGFLGWRQLAFSSPLVSIPKTIRLAQEPSRVTTIFPPYSRISPKAYSYPDKQKPIPEIVYITEFFIALAICNTVVVSAPDQPRLRETCTQKLKSILEEIDIKTQTPKPRSPSGAVAPSRRFALIINGPTLEFALHRRLQNAFMQLARKVRAVICCRATPLQKSKMASIASFCFEGDGANDVSMIQVADIGIGISGQEGMQAVLASDFAISQFQHLRKLLFVHGHWCYTRLANMILYFFYKNLAYVSLLFWYQFFCGFSGTPMIDYWSLIFFNLLFTSVPPVIYGVFDKDVSAETLMKHPELYKASQKNQVFILGAWLTYLKTPSVYQILVPRSLSHNFYNFFLSDFLKRNPAAGILGLAIAISESFPRFGLDFNSGSVGDLSLGLGMQTYIKTIIHFSVFAGSIFLYFFILGLLGAFCVLCNPPANPYWIIQRQLMNPMFYLDFTIAITLALLPRVPWNPEPAGTETASEPNGLIKRS